MAWSGGSISFSGSVPSSSYGATYTPPTYSGPPAGYYVSAGPYIKSGGASTVSCNTTASVTWEVELQRDSPLSLIYETTTITATAPACPLPPTPTDGKLDIYSGGTWVSVYPKVYVNGSWTSGTVYAYNGTSWVKAQNS